MRQRANLRDAVLLMCGLVLFALVTPPYDAAVQLGLLTAAVGLTVLPPVRRRLNSQVEPLRHPGPRKQLYAAAGIAVAVPLLLYGWSVIIGRPFQPLFHDESSYALQIRMLAAGRLWLPAHELAEFFDTFHVITQPVYASAYFPGTALLYVPIAVLGFPLWVGPLLVTGACAGLLYLIVTRLVDGIGGALAAVLFATSPVVRFYGHTLISHTPALLLGLLMIGAWLRWRQNPRGRWLAAVGAAAGWMAITRPVDALVFAGAVGCGLAWDHRKAGLRPIIVAAGIIIAAATPFLALQAWFNYGVTGDVLRTPFDMYVARDQPYMSYGFHDPPEHVGIGSDLPQKQALYSEWILPSIREHRPVMALQELISTRLPATLLMSLPTILVVAVPLGLLTFGTAGRLIVIATLPGYFALYLSYTFFLYHYALALLPAVLLLAVLGVGSVGGPAARINGIHAFTVAVTAVALTLYRPLVPQVPNAFPDRVLATADSLSAGIGGPAVVLFTYTAGDNYHAEPVYNIDTPWPDEAAVVRAHDRGDDNERIIAYYASRHPRRQFYIFDRAALRLISIAEWENAGSASDAAENLPE